MAFGWDDAIGIGASVLGFLGQEETNQANAQQADKQMEFQREMSSTAYQRATADMKAAGLNPMLAYSQGGATTPGGAMATMQNSTASAAANASQALQQRNVIAQTDNVRADTALKNSQALVNQATVPKLVQDTLTGSFSASQLEQLSRRLREENDAGFSGENVRRLTGQGSLYGQQSLRESYEAEMARQRYVGSFGDAQVRNLRETTRATAARALLDELEAGGRGVSEKRYFDDVGKGHFYLQSGASAVSSAAQAARGLGLRLRR